MYQNLKKKSEGFTIIEVLIVLAIAGLIMLIVFLAVPALQRNSRNNSRRNDASRVLAAANEWRTNNNNQMPAAANEAAILSLSGNLNYFDTIDIVAKGAVGYDTLAYYNNQAEVQIVTGANCASASSKSAGNGIVAIFRIETGNNQTAPTCLSS
jgi:prepilin-type N-terminal cleavage/methylation domain-containing protein